MELSTCCDSERWLETDLCRQCKEHADFYDEDEQESAELIEELESIYLCDGWRKNDRLSDRVAAIKDRLEELLT
jgi:hypothetical protein